MTTSLHQSPFWLLGASMRDDRRRIVELAEEKSLDLDSETCQRARADLTHPRTRLTMEIGWFPGVSPKKTSDLMQLLSEQPSKVRTQVGLPALARANLLAAAFECVDEKDPAIYPADFILELAQIVDQITADEVLRDVNEDRTISGFPEIKSADHVENDLVERKRIFRNTIKAKLNDFQPTLLIEIMTQVVKRATDNGNRHAPQLIDELVDSYELEVQVFLHTEGENVVKLVDAARCAADAGPTSIDSLTYLIDKLDKVVANWNKITQPIQLSAKARGTQHDASRELAYAIRSLSIDLFNQHNLVDQTTRLTGMLKARFANIPDVSERLEQDEDALTDIVLERAASAEQDREFAAGITYRVEIGLVLKDVLAISPEGLEWKGKWYPLNTITRVRWGGMKHSINGIPTGTTYTIGFGDHRSESVVETRKGDIYSAFTERLWQAVCFRIMVEMVQTLGEGKTIRFGDAVLSDTGVTLVKHKFMGTEGIFCDWSQVHVWSADGSFIIGKKDDKKVYSSMSYINTANAHVLEQCIRSAFKKGIERLSDVFKD